MFYLVGAILSVPPLALSTLYLLGNEKTADRIAVVAFALSLAVGTAFLLAAIPTPPKMPPKNSSKEKPSSAY